VGVIGQVAVYPKTNLFIVVSHLSLA